MLFTKCDLCKRVIKDSEEITASFGWKRYSLCVRCGEPTARDVMAKRTSANPQSSWLRLTREAEKPSSKTVLRPTVSATYILVK
jgi:hypothetical protein